MGNRGVIESNRSESSLVYRFIRDNQPVTVQEIADGCFPITFGRADPLYGRLMKKSLEKTFASFLWLRAHGVALTCISRPGLRSQFVLGWVAQGPEALSAVSDRSIIRSLEALDVIEPLP